MRLCRLSEPGHNALIGGVGFDGRSELLTRDPSKIHQPCIHRTGVNVFSFRPGKHGPAFIDHPSQVGIVPQYDTHAAGKLLSEIHRVN
jgi:hypothetical protein